MRSANPALNNNTFRTARRVSGETAMTIDGTVNKTALSLLLVMTSAIYTWNNPQLGLALFWPVTIFTFILLMITIFNKIPVSPLPNNGPINEIPKKDRMRFRT